MKVRVAVKFQNRAVLVPIAGDSSVTQLLQQALKRLGLEDQLGVPDLWVALDGSITEICGEDAVEDVLRDGDTVMLMPKVSAPLPTDAPAPPAAATQPAAAETPPLLQGPPSAQAAGHTESMVIEGEGQGLAVHYCLLGNIKGVVHIDPNITSADDLGRLIDRAAFHEEDSTATIVELYAETGEPLGGGDRPLVEMAWPSSGIFQIYGIRRLVQTEMPEEPTESADPSQGDSQLFIRDQRTFVVNVDLLKDTVLMLKLKIKQKVGVPVLMQTLVMSGRSFRDNSITLKEAGVQNNSSFVLTIAPPPLAASRGIWGRSPMFAAGAYTPMRPQTQIGLASFFSSLYSLTKLPPSRHPQLLGALRRYTALPPLVSALKATLSNQTSSPAQRAAVVEGLWWLFRRMLPNQLPGTSTGFPDHQVFEASFACWAHLLKCASVADEATDVRECWRDMLLRCALTFSPLQDPVQPPPWWKPKQVQKKPCSRAAVLEAIAEDRVQAEGQPASGPLLSPEDLLPLPEVARLVAGHPDQGLGISVWRPTAVARAGCGWGCAAHEVPAATYKEMEASIATAQDGLLRLRSPLELKEAPAPTLHPGTLMPCVYVGRNKDAIRTVQLFNPLTGDASTHDVDSLAATLADVAPAALLQSGPVSRLSRPPREAIVVLLDTSTSMSERGFADEIPAVEAQEELSEDMEEVSSEDDSDENMFEDLHQMSLAELKNRCRSLDLPYYGTKAVLMQRVSDRLEQQRREKEREEAGAPPPKRPRIERHPTIVQAPTVHHQTPRVEPLSRLDTVKQLFTAFANRSMAYDLPHVVGLTIFHTRVEKKHGLTEAFELFASSVQQCKADGCTMLFDGLEAARKELEDFTQACTNAPPEGILKRIIVLSDGQDQGSKSKPHAVAGLLQRDGVVVDSVIIGDQIQDLTLRAITMATGGCSFHPTSLREALQLFEAEPLLSLRQREGLSTAEPVTTETQLKRLAGGRGGWDKMPGIRVPEAAKAPALQPAEALSRARAHPPMAMVGPNDASRLRRIMAELVGYQRNPHPHIAVFPSEKRMDVWRLLLEGPHGTPYEGGVFRLWIRFPPEYPAEAPECRFETPIHHCNINSSGKVCHSVFDRNWTTDLTVREMLNCVYGLLLSPEPDDPLDSMLATQYHTDRAGYESQAAALTRAHALTDYDKAKEELLAGGQGSKEGHPEHLVCPITLDLFVDPVMTKYGHTYERSAILKQIRLHKVDPFRQRLTEQDLIPNITIRKAVEQYKASTPWWERD